MGLMTNFNKLGLIHKLLNNVTISSNNNIIYRRNIFASSTKFDLMEFFDDKKNWGAQEVKSGRSWNREELRLKSNGDLHKLYVLLKERNMLLTMEQEAKDQTRLFPSPERIDKVEDSMENLEAVVRERNIAYHQLETGETGERPSKVEIGRLGLKYNHRRDFNHVIGLLKRFPNMDMVALKEQYPDVDLERAKRSLKCRGHFVPK
ncbi:hypothetical protein NQ317_002217 [Molorchus minor]|uniref:Large ribosomal subunit protein uL29m n=1 Tax=Molorchus minor TaxID=1323400 RepID=A0ABQ9JQI5_9CUCU|nr:hypothetical protein NQ317_002217 [Molorchus minor]